MSLPISNEELVTVREAMRALNQLLRRLERGELEKLVLMQRGRMVAVVYPWKDED